MKTIVLAALALVLLGGGCVGSPSEVSGKWRLAFDLPEGWVMVKNYRQDSNSVPELSEDVNRNLADVVLQSTSLPVYTGGIALDASVDANAYAMDDFAFVRAFRIDARRIMPADAEDLGNGWLRVKLCEPDEDCTIYGAHNYTYYYEAPSGDKYMFNITTSGQTADQAITVIMSAEEVAAFTDTPVIEAETE